MTDNQQANLKEPSHLLHYTTQRTHARLFLERGAACALTTHSSPPHQKRKEKKKHFLKRKVTSTPKLATTPAPSRNRDPA